MDYTTIVVAVLASPIVAKAFDLFVGLFKKSPAEQAIFALLQDRLENLLTDALDRDYTTQNEFKKMRSFLTAYENLDGNDYIHDLWERYKELEFK